MYLKTLTCSVIDIEHFRNFSWLTITSNIESSHPELVLTTSCQTSDHKSGDTDFCFLGLQN